VLTLSRTGLLFVGVLAVACGDAGSELNSTSDAGRVEAQAPDAASPVEEASDAGQIAREDAGSEAGNGPSEDAASAARLDGALDDAAMSVGDAAKPGSPGDAASAAATTGGDGAVKLPRLPTGFASTPSNGLTTTTGGGTAAPNVATNCALLKSWLEDASARVVELPAGTTLDCRSNPTTIQACELKCSSSSSKVFWRVPVGDQTCTSLADFNGDGTLDVPAGTLVDKQRSDFTIRVKSNKTLRGAGPGATLLGVSLNIDKQSNIIIENIALREINPSLIEAGDAITINDSHHVWLDHCAFSLISDGYMDIRDGSSNITVSYNHIDGQNAHVCDGQHNFISLVSDSQATYDHNRFDHVGGRNPKVTGASLVHLYSNGYEGVSYFCASAGAGSEVLVEGNHYFDSRYPHWAEEGKLEASGNQYAGSTSSAGRDSNADVFAPPYPYTLDPVASLRAALSTQTGPRAP
jgi:pectate lyase